MHAGNQFISKVLHIEITAVDLRRSPFIRNRQFSNRRVLRFSAEIWKEIARLSPLRMQKRMDGNSQTVYREYRSCESRIGTQNGNGEREAAYWSRLVYISFEYRVILIVKTDICHTFAYHMIMEC